MIKFIQKAVYILIILDVMLPGMDGIELLTRLRRESDAYVILLTARTEETDKIVGLSVGADDYVTKPFSPRELAARVKAALRRLQGGGERTEGGVLNFKHLRIDPAARQAWMDEQPLDLTATEFDLLYTLAQHRGMVLTREQLLEKVWGGSYFGELRVVDVHLDHVRRKHATTSSAPAGRKTVPVISGGDPGWGGRSGYDCRISCPLGICQPS